jgi:Protein of unknown function (DUF2971)
VHEEHPAFDPPEDPDGPIWRFTDLAKFLSLLLRRELYFHRSDLQEDPFEGAIWKLYGQNGKPTRKLHGTARRWLAEGVFVNSWHCNEHESMAMWKIYGAESSGIALRSTYNRLIKSFPEKNEPIHVGVVRYIDFDEDAEPQDEDWLPFMHKRKAYEYEQELRALTRADDADAAGVYVGVDLDELVEGVVLAPGTPEWVLDVVRDLAERYELAAPVEPSEVDLQVP